VREHARPEDVEPVADDERSEPSEHIPSTLAGRARREQRFVDRKTQRPSAAIAAASRASAEGLLRTTSGGYAASAAARAAVSGSSPEARRKVRLRDMRRRMRGTAAGWLPLPELVPLNGRRH
jgi:hypothetical protein